VIVNDDAAITRAIHGEPTKVPTNAGLALARQAVKAQRDTIVAMEKRAAEAAASHGTETPSQNRDDLRSDQNKIQRPTHAAMRMEGQNQAQALSADSTLYKPVSILV
jgi:hypothetical protein